ncbi:hypothetical protein BVRB_006620 [Beta vulgaris subsp. vulgaris]|uniref:Tetratricopeptide repeat protein n=1 Tax=Beta vulgaris subsp. vulgaris TaxID=3555 RepID=A0A0J8B3B5_BETVV|nr:uncharacterized protein LOC104884185 isoform X2 [Beta vulgaris subsp. vulgaris]KMS95614.1 hypothetical protein BVRB_006620 [Beta vulgaris subsp. vulgaris]
MLESAPSFTIYANKKEGDVEDEEKEERENVDKIYGEIMGSGEFSFAKPDLDLINEEGDNDVLSESVVGFEKLGTDEQEVRPGSPLMYLATGLGIKEEREYNEDYYRELLQEYPNHPLILKKYAQLLQNKGDLEGAEEYYFRATKADPGDGETLSQYAILVWELHRDQERALKYFELSAQTASKDSNVLAAYAKFLWEIDDEEDDYSYTIHPDHGQEDLQEPIHLYPADGITVGIDGLAGGNDIPMSEAGVPLNSADAEEYYRRMTEEDPSDPSYLKKYAQFLYQSKRDLQGAEEIYARVVLAYPQDGEILSQYATLLWELYHDPKRTLSYMEEAIKAAPEDSNILAAYARFLWIIDDDEF